MSPPSPPPCLKYPIKIACNELSPWIINLLQNSDPDLGKEVSTAIFFFFFSTPSATAKEVVLIGLL